MGHEDNSHIDDAAMLYNNVENLNNSETVIIQHTQKLKGSNSLFYTPVVVADKLTLGAMMDSGSMACSLSAEAQKKLIDAGAIHLGSEEVTDVVFVGCGGVRVKPESLVDLEMVVYGCRVSMPTFIVENQRDDSIIGSNVIRHLICQFKSDASYWKAMSSSASGDQEREQFLFSLAWSVGLMVRYQTKFAQSGATELSLCLLAVSSLCGALFLRTSRYLQAVVS